MFEKIPIITLLLTLFTNGLILIMFFPVWKKEKFQEFDNDLKYVGFGKRFLAFIIDVCIWYSVIYIFKKIVLGKISFAGWINVFIIDITEAVILISIVTFFIVKYGGTPGKVLLKIKIVSIHGGNLSIGRALLRQLITMASNIIVTLQQYYIVSIFMRIDKAVKSSDFSNFYDFRTDILVLAVSGFICLIIFLSDSLLILANKRKRAIHDFLANSIVIQK